jgi:hypothetical protein
MPAAAVPGTSPPPLPPLAEEHGMVTAPWVPMLAELYKGRVAGLLVI